MKVVLDEDQNKIEVVVSEEHLSLAIGRRGQNVKLATELTLGNRYFNRRMRRVFKKTRRF